jgi:RNA polymerase sigma factor (TIGR02999 family)
MDDSTSPGDVTELIVQARKGDDRALKRLLPTVYDELRRMARQHLRRERSDHTLDGTALVHEAYLRLVGSPSPDWQDRAHFFGIAARCMRQVLVDHARARGAAKRGGAWERTSLTNKGLGVALPLTELIALDEALERLGELDPRLLKVVEYRFFGGLEEREIAELLGVTRRTVQRDWVAARTWLYKELFGTPEDPDPMST